MIILSISWRLNTVVSLFTPWMIKASSSQYSLRLWYAKTIRYCKYNGLRYISPPGNQLLHFCFTYCVHCTSHIFMEMSRIFFLNALCTKQALFSITVYTNFFTVEQDSRKSKQRVNYRIRLSLSAFTSAKLYIFVKLCIFN